jgi:hypothetical protein
MSKAIEFCEKVLRLEKENQDHGEYNEDILAKAAPKLARMVKPIEEELTLGSKLQEELDRLAEGK